MGMTTFRTSAAWTGLLCVLCAGSFAAGAEDAWRTFHHDGARSGATTEALKTPLHLQWVLDAGQPIPSWPGPAKHDYFHRKHNLKPMVTFDTVYHPVAADGKVLFASTPDGSVRCLDAETGKTVWTFFTEEIGRASCRERV